MKIFKRVLGDSGSEIIYSTFTLLLYFKKNVWVCLCSGIIPGTGNITVKNNNKRLYLKWKERQYEIKHILFQMDIKGYEK